MREVEKKLGGSSGGEKKKKGSLVLEFKSLLGIAVVTVECDARV